MLHTTYVAVVDTTSNEGKSRSKDTTIPDKTEAIFFLHHFLIFITACIPLTVLVFVFTLTLVAPPSSLTYSLQQRVDIDLLPTSDAPAILVICLGDKFINKVMLHGVPTFVKASLFIPLLILYTVMHTLH